jgi:hypothetical protein
VPVCFAAVQVLPPSLDSSTQKRGVLIVESA